jgi:hypothetical protein
VVGEVGGQVPQDGPVLDDADGWRTAHGLSLSNAILPSQYPLVAAALENPPG